MAGKLSELVVRFFEFISGVEHGNGHGNGKDNNNGNGATHNSADAAYESEQQVEPATPATHHKRHLPLEITQENIGASLFSVNQAAQKRKRSAIRQYELKNYDGAKKSREEKTFLYDLKNRAIDMAFSQNMAKLIGYHMQFRKKGEGNIEAYFSCYDIAGYKFHMPVEKTPEIAENARFNRIDMRFGAKNKIDLNTAVATLKKFINEE